MNEEEYRYSWHQTLTRVADGYLVVGARDIGKTFGLRKDVLITDFIKRGNKFFEFVRFKNQISDFANSYFRKINDSEFFPNHIFKTVNRVAYIADKPKEDEKPIWREMGYFGALSEMQQKKTIAYAGVRNFVLDEAIIDKKLDRYHTYLPNEYFILANYIDTVSRETIDGKSVRPRLFLLGNAVDFTNPYFMILGVKPNIKYGYHWFRNKTFLLHYVDPKNYSKAKETNTVAGRMLAGTQFSDIANSNVFSDIDMEFIEPKTKESKFRFGIIYKKKMFGVWFSPITGNFYITSKIPNNSRENIYSLTLEDNSLAYVMCKKASHILTGMRELHYYGCLRYESIYVRQLFYEVLNTLGVR